MHRLEKRLQGLGRDWRDERKERDSLTEKIIACAYKVHSELGPGYKESIYHRALTIEFDVQHIPYESEKRILIKYRNKNAGYYTPDFVINKKVIVEIKAADNMPKLYETQLYYYLKGTDYKLGYIVNFGGVKIDIRRRVYEAIRKKPLISVN